MLIYRYLTREILVTMLAVTAVLLLIFLSNAFVRYLGDVASGNLPGDTVLILVLLKSIRHLSVILPLAFYFAILLSFGRLYKDSEMVALAACGVGQSSLMKIVLITMPLVIPLVAFLALYASPWAAESGYRIQDEAQHSSELAGIAPGRFRESRAGDLIIYVNSVSPDQKTMGGVFAQSRDMDAVSVIASNEGYRYTDPATGDEFMVLVDGYRYEGRAGDGDYTVVKFEKHGVRIDQREGPAESKVKRNALPTAQLWDSEDLRNQAELQRRLVLPLTTFVLALLAVPLSRTTPREGRYARLFSAVLIYIIYNNVMGIAQGWVEQGVVPTALGVWWVAALLFVATLALMLYQSRNHLWWLERLSSRQRRSHS